MASQYYDLGKDFYSFNNAIGITTETVKNKFEQSINSKIKGRKIKARASRGYKQFEKDYEINVSNVSIDDYYDNYVVVAKDNNGKEYFLRPGFKIQILGSIEQSPQPPVSQDVPQKPVSIPQPSVPQNQPISDIENDKDDRKEKSDVKEFTKSGPGIIRTYPRESIEKDLSLWLSPLVPENTGNFKSYIEKEGISRTQGRKTVSTYQIRIPVTDAPGITNDQLKRQLESISNYADSVNDITTYYSGKMNINGDQYLISIEKITNY